MRRKRALAVLTVGAGILLTWMPAGGATQDPPPGPVIAESKPAAPPGPPPSPLAESVPLLQPIASSAPAGGEGRAGEKPAAFRRLDAPEPAVPGPLPSPAGPLQIALPVVMPPPAPAPEVAPAAPQASPLSLFVQAPERVALGEVVAFTLHVRNGGAAPVAHVTVRDRLPAGLQHPEGDFLENDLGTLAPGESKKLELKVRAARPGALVNQAEALARDVVLASVDTTVTVEESASLVIRQVGPERPLLERPCDYRLEVVNSTGRDAHDVQLQAQLSAGLAFLEAGSGGVFDPASRTVRWGLGTLPAGQQRAVILRLLPRASGVQVNQLLARTGEGREVHLQTPLQVHTAGASVAQLKVVGPHEVLTVGKELVYEVHVANPGTTALKGVQLAALLPAGVTPRRGDGPTPARVHGQEVLFAPLPSLAPRTQVVYRIRVLGNQTGVGRMRVRLTGDPGGVPLFRDFNVIVVRLGPARDARA